MFKVFASSSPSITNDSTDNSLIQRTPFIEVQALGYSSVVEELSARFADHPVYQAQDVYYYLLENNGSTRRLTFGDI